MPAIKAGSTVTIEFTGKLSSGQVFGTATQDQPHRFTIGQGETLDGVEEAVMGMSAGERKTAIIPEEKGFGPRTESRVFHVRREALPVEMTPSVGTQVNLMTSEGKKVPARVVEESESEVVFDANHPLAGQNLIVSFRILEVE